MTDGEKGIRNLRRLIWFLAPIAVYLLLAVMLVPNVKADDEIRAEFSYNTNATGSPVEGYHVYRDDAFVDIIPVEEVTGFQRTDPDTGEVSDAYFFTYDCASLLAGYGEFELTAVHEDGYETGRSNRYPFTVPRCETVIMHTIVLETNAPQ